MVLSVNGPAEAGPAMLDTCDPLHIQGGTQLRRHLANSGRHGTAIRKRNSLVAGDA